MTVRILFEHMQFSISPEQLSWTMLVHCTFKRVGGFSVNNVVTATIINRAYQVGAGVLR